MRQPGHSLPETVCREPAMTFDLLPTLGKLAGADLPQHKIDGLDIWPLISGQPGAKSPHQAYYFYWNNELQAVRSGQWKLHFPHSYITLGEKSHGKDGRPAVYDQAKTPLALYDLEKDSGESKNVVDQHPEIVSRLKQLGEQIRAELGDSATKRTGTGVRPLGRE
jgi:arylsulfatase A-like enzyme